MTVEKNMLEYRQIGAPSQYAEAATYEPAADIHRIAGVVRRQFLNGIVGAVVGALLAVFALMMIQPTYQSSVRILLDQDRTRLLNKISGEEAPASTEEYIATQIAIIESDIVARRVIHSMGLVYDAEAKEIRTSSSGAAGETKDRVSRVTSDVLNSAGTDERLVAAVQRSLLVYQVEKSFVIEIAATDPDPKIAQRLAAAYGDAYLTDQLSARFESTKSAGTWLEDRINTLRDQSLEANAEVEKFRAENNLVSTDGRLVSDQQLGTLNEQLAQAQLAVTRIGAKVEVFRDAVESEDATAVIAIVGASTEIPETAAVRVLRSDYLEGSRRLADVTERWGPENAQAGLIRDQMDRTAKQILDEARRILAGYTSDLRTAQTEADSTAASVAAATGHSQSDNSILVALRNIEQKSASYNALYQDYLARYQEAVQQQTLSLTTGRTISSAALPTSPIFPNKKIILALLTILGAGAGGAVGVGRELFDRSFRSRKDVERDGVDFLGYVGAPGSGKWYRRKSFAKDREDVGAYIIALAERIDRSEPALDTIRDGVEICRRGASRVVAIVSLESSLSRSALALALAIREARNGRRILLVDGDRNGQALTLALAGEGAHSFSDVVVGGVPLETAAKPIVENLRFLAAEKASWESGTTGFFSADKLKAWGMAFDLVIVDLPPAGPISEVRALAPALDGYICAVEWGLTPRDRFSNLVRSGSGFGNKLIGVAIMNVNTAKQHLYDNDFPRNA